MCDRGNPRRPDVENCHYPKQNQCLALGVVESYAPVAEPISSGSTSLFLGGARFSSMPLTLPIPGFCIIGGAGNLACSRLLGGSFGLCAGLRTWQTPAESRLQPGLAAPRFVQGGHRDPK